MANSTDLLLFPLKFTFIGTLIAADVFLSILLLHSLQILDAPLYANSIHSDTKNKARANKSLSKDAQHTALAMSAAIENTATSIGKAASSVAQTIEHTTTTITKGVVATITNPITIIQPEPSHALPQIKTIAVSAPIAGAPSSPTQSIQTTSSTAPQKPQPSTASVWPLHGRVTTQFGVYHEPYQPWHTGIDISSSLPVGRATITPFRQGVVKSVIWSHYQLGNHIIIDHGGGLTSYYCHLSSITVRQGQTVKPGDLLGYEGSTGASTGPHLHFEIRQNNQPINPHKFIPGAP